jgi:hypothetical protein
MSICRIYLKFYKKGLILSSTIFQIFISSKGNIMFNGLKFNYSDLNGLIELVEYAALCNDSTLDYNEVNQSFFFISFSIMSFLFLIFE